MLGFIKSDRLLGLKETRPTWYAFRLQGGRDGQANGLIGPGWIRHKQIRLQRIQSPVDTFYGCIIGLQIYADICPFHHVLYRVRLTLLQGWIRLFRLWFMVLKSAVSIISSNLHFRHFTRM